jgi:hypothetical protein
MEFLEAWSSRDGWSSDRCGVAGMDGVPIGVEKQGWMEFHRRGVAGMDGVPRVVE